MARLPKAKPISLSQQYIAIRRQYENIVDSKFEKNQIIFKFKIKPTEESEEYLVRVSYKLHESPIVVLLEPEMKLHNGKRPHHIYGLENGHPILCLYYPKSKEWNKNLYIADTIIPWISTWLFAYEYWQITGKWNYNESNALKGIKKKVKNSMDTEQGDNLSIP
ncbi:hypothetical protein [Methanobrevibacter sp.]|uniref:hypothetical protein n=1 Tax=Methanobrevibacter sp. TaxID=66852 RepID=UPI0038653150